MGIFLSRLAFSLCNRDAYALPKTIVITEATIVAQAAMIAASTVLSRSPNTLIASMMKR